MTGITKTMAASYCTRMPSAHSGACISASLVPHWPLAGACSCGSLRGAAWDILAEVSSLTRSQFYLKAQVYGVVSNLRRVRNLFSNSGPGTQSRNPSTIIDAEMNNKENCSLNPLPRTCLHKMEPRIVNVRQSPHMSASVSHMTGRALSQAADSTLAAVRINHHCPH